MQGLDHRHVAWLLLICLDLSTVSHWSWLNDHALILHRYWQPVAIVRVACLVRRSSRIAKLSDQICDGDKIQVDEVSCEVKVEKL